MSVRAVLVTMFEPENGPAGELSPYRAAFGLEPLALPGSGLDRVYANADRSLIAIVAGVGTANTAVALMALGHALDLSEARWLISGIAGVNPNTGTLGGVYWADWVVDGDLAHEVDPRSAPADWPIGIFPLGAKEPYGVSNQQSGVFGRPYQRFRINAELLHEALTLTEDIPLADHADLDADRRAYGETSVAAQPPRVAVGGSLSAARFWHGPHHNAWAERWMRYWTDDNARFVTSAMEDTGSLHAIDQLARMGRARSGQTLVLRAGSNFTTPPPNRCPVESLVGESDVHYPSMGLALENLGRVGGTVLRAWLGQ